MSNIHTAVIQAGGMGTRLRSITNDLIPKPMVMLCGKPMLQWQIENLKTNGVYNIYIVIGHLGEVIQKYFENGSRFGVNIEYIKEEIPLGSAGALYYIKEKLVEDNFILIYSDVMFDIDFERMENFHIQKKAYISLLVHPNMHPYDSDIIEINKDDCVTGILSKNTKRMYWYNNCVNSGIFIVSRDVVQNITKCEKLDFEKNIIMRYLPMGRVFGYKTTEYVKDAGTVTRLCEVQDAFMKYIPQKRNLLIKQKCVFLDRDGTINKYKGLLYKEDDLELENGVVEAISQINNSEYLAIVITNQPVVARGLCSISDIENIHRKLETLLGNQGVYLDDIAYCPHHPEKGFEGENKVYKIECKCRKPNIGLIEKMAEKYNINLEESYFVGDTTVDIKTGKNAGMKTVLLRTGEGGKDGKYHCLPDFVVSDLQEAVKLIINSGGYDGL